MFSDDGDVEGGGRDGDEVQLSLKLSSDGEGPAGFLNQFSYTIRQLFEKVINNHFLHFICVACKRCIRRF